MICKYCKYCEPVFGRQGGYLRFFCTHPRQSEKKDSRGYSYYNFISYSDKYGSVSLKTSKRWCPLKEKE